MLAPDRCPTCANRLVPDWRDRSDHQCGFRCPSDHWFPFVNGIPVLIDEATSLFRLSDFTSGATTTMPARSFATLRRLLPHLGSNVGAEGNFRRLREALRQNRGTARVLVLGGSIVGDGLEQLEGPGVELVETDVSFGPRTRYIVDAHQIPWADGTFDAVVCQATLQCIADPGMAVSEMHRVLKPGGLIYVELSFLQPVVDGKYDFQRWTINGLFRLFREFKHLSSGPVGAAGQCLASAVQSYGLAWGKSKAWRGAVRLACALGLSWLKWTDRILVHRPTCYDAAPGYWFLGAR